MIHTDICIIGAGPVGLFAVFEAGLLKMRCHVVDVLQQVGGQLAEVYPSKPIYDIPGYPEIQARQLIERLMEQIASFNPGFTLGERVESIKRQPDGSLVITTNDGTQIACKVLVIAAGLGCFEPRKPNINDLSKYEGNGVSYMIKDHNLFQNKNVVIAGGGDAALDWSIVLAGIAQRLTLVHRGNTFRGSPDSAQKVFDLAKQGKIDLILESNLIAVNGQQSLESVRLEGRDKTITELQADYLIPLFGLSPQLGPITKWQLSIDKSAIPVNTVDYSTDSERIYAIGDINTYPGKIKLILCGFHEAALMAQSAFKYVFPDQKLSFKYTTVYGKPTI